MDSLAQMRIAIYARFSSENQKDTSIDDQVRLCREHVARFGGKVSDERIFADHAMSGARKDRPAFERLFRLVESRSVDVIVTEAADRLSRDLGDADRCWKLIDYHGVRLICVSDGIDSASEGARMQFRFKAIFADEFLVDLGKKTRRGQRGAAERGHCTGGLPLGYTSRAIWSGGREPDGFEIVVDPDRAAIVVRIFELYRDGHSLLSIAKRLNDDAVPPPRAESRRTSCFWRKTTLREMLTNRAYIGVWTFGRKQWRKDPVTRKRRSTKRAAHEVFTVERPHLRIISQSLWDAVESRRKAVYANYTGGDGGAPGRRTAHPFAGLLRCGLCGHRMSDGGGTSSRYYRCSGAMTGGICTNRQPVREDALIEAAVTELRRVLFATDLQEQLRSRIESRLRSFNVERGEDTKNVERELARVDEEVARLITFIRSTDPATSPGVFESVRPALEEATARQRSARAKLEALRTSGTSEPRAPTVEEIAELVRDVEARIKDDPTSAREALRQMLLSGHIKMTPNADGSYQAESILVLGRLTWKMRKPRSGNPAGASGDSSVVGIDGCAGWN